MQRSKDTFFSKKQSINIKKKIYDLSTPKIMGIINITPDSFYDGGKTECKEQILQQARTHIDDGADILDIGGYSSRPGAQNISEKEERSRIIPAIEVIKKHFPGIVISLDTFRASIAKDMVNDYNIDIINDISAGNMDDNMFKTIANLNIPYIMMHMKGVPQNMHNMAHYDNMLKEIIYFFSEKIRMLKLSGVKDIIIDPGFGFGKNIDQNFTLLRNLDVFNFFELPVLVGLSRKSMIYKTLHSDPGNALNGTTVLHTLALLKNVNILRVHDVKQARETVILMNKFLANT